MGKLMRGTSFGKSKACPPPYKAPLTWDDSIILMEASLATFLSEEEKYTKNVLTRLVVTFKGGMKCSHILPVDKINTIFGNVETLLRLHELINQEIRTNVKAVSYTHLRAHE